MTVKTVCVCALYFLWGQHLHSVLKCHKTRECLVDVTGDPSRVSKSVFVFFAQSELSRPFDSQEDWTTAFSSFPRHTQSLIRMT